MENLGRQVEDPATGRQAKSRSLDKGIVPIPLPLSEACPFQLDDEDPGRLHPGQVLLQVPLASAVRASWMSASPQGGGEPSLQQQVLEMDLAAIFRLLLPPQP